jgi:SEC-C motif-containing protein
MDAEALMRSRYTAYTLGDAAYLLATWHPDTRPGDLDLDAEPRPKWLGLQVRRHVQSDPDHAEVEFVARYKIAGRAQRMHELSRFVRRDGRWYYLDGSQLA